PLLAPAPPSPPFVPTTSTSTFTCLVLARRLGRSCDCSVASTAAAGISTASRTLSGWARQRTGKPRRRQALSCGARASSLEITSRGRRRASVVAIAISCLTMEKTVSPCEFTAVSSAPHLNNRSAASWWPKEHAECNGVNSSLSFELTLTPSCKRASMAAREPDPAARWNGVRPLEVRPSTSTPASMNT
ncbi:unnamed protein product, partial [Ectocarpus sp. 12 AP-2014]